MKKIALSSFHLKNFKAVRNSGRLKLTPLTAFIGHNGSGKSSLVEALET
ncbi:MAG: AAA family ATPase, partial [Nitrospina sp.]|nr:AAA family ATPase [Nitrospina sp.]